MPNTNQTINFAGNLTDSFDVGEELTLKFNVKKIYPDKEYLTIDYRIDLDKRNNSAPEIENYIVK